MYLTLNRPTPGQITTAVGLLKAHRADLQAAGSGLPWGRINYTVWSDVFVCSECSGEVVFWDVAVDMAIGKVRDEFNCTHCKARLTKRSIERAFVTIRDASLNQTIRQLKQVPVLIYHTVGKQRLEKKPDDFDRALLAQSRATSLPLGSLLTGCLMVRNLAAMTTLASPMYTTSTHGGICELSLRCGRVEDMAAFQCPHAPCNEIASNRCESVSEGKKREKVGATVGVLRDTVHSI